MSTQIDWPGTHPVAARQARRATARVAIQAADELVASGVYALLHRMPCIELVAEAEHADISVVVAGPDLAAQLTTTIPLVLIADDLRQGDLWIAIQHGLIVLLPRHQLTKLRLLRAVVNARDGHGHIPPEQLGTMLHNLARLQENTLAPRNLTLCGLSPRELDLIRLLAEGLDTGDLARRLGYSERTVKNILASILARLNLRNRAHIVAHALHHGLI